MRSLSLALLSCVLLRACAFDTLQSRDISVLDAVQRVAWHHKRRLSNLPWRAKNAKAVGEGAGKTVNAANCFWEEARGECVPERAATLALLRQTEDAYGQLVADYLECVDEKDKETCLAFDQCYWDRDEDECDLSSYTQGREDSPCAIKAAATMSLGSAISKCQGLEQQSSCAGAVECTWSSDEQECDVDIYHLYLGFSVDDMLALTEELAPQMAMQLQSEFDTSDPEFLPKDVLSWDGSKATCPEGTFEPLCKFVQVFIGRLQSVEFYCSLEYRPFFSFPGCIADSLCQFNVESFSCELADAQTGVAVWKAFQATSSFVKGPVDRQFISALGECALHLTEETCTGNCEPDEDEDEFSCGIADAALAKIFAEAGKGESDPLCMFVYAQSSIDCYNRKTIDACHATRDCDWTTDECEVSFDYMVLTVAKTDPVTDDSYTKLVDQCAELGSSEVCADSSEAKFLTS